METHILAVIVTYYPDKTLLKNNVSAIIDEIGKILIWENTPAAEKLQFRFIDNPKVEYCGDGVNSISHALNYAWRYAENHGYDYLLTMDQDSVFLNFSHYLKSTVFNSNCPQGIWTPSIIDKAKADMNLEDIGETTEVISGFTSGMLQKTTLVSKCGGWNEAFAIDGLDIEYCFRAWRKGIKCYKVKNTYLVHRLGNPIKCHVMQYNSSLYNYSPQRYYGIFRSHAILIRMFPEQQAFATHFKLVWYSKIKWIVCFEDRGIVKLYYILKGIVSGNCCRLPIHSMETKERKGAKMG